MSRFVRIRNKADFVDRRRLEKLGISTKRDDSDTIGQFGSGAKLAPIAALREGIRWVTVASDENGPYVMEYVSKDVDGIDTIFYKYHDQYEKESSFTVDAGVLSWDDNFQIFREAFSNALDEKEYRIDRDVVVEDKFEHCPGYVDVYLSEHDAVNYVLDHFDWFFLVDKTPILTTPSGSVYTPSRKGCSRIFNKDVFVLNLPEEDVSGGQTFDWGFSDLELNEERRVKSEYSVERAIIRVLSEVPDSDDGRNFVSSVFDKEPNEFVSFVSYSVEIMSKYPSVWADVWIERFGEKAIPVIKDDILFETIKSNLRALNYSACAVSKTLYSILVKAGVASPMEILGGKANISVIECPATYKEMFDHALRTVARYDSRISDIPVKIMESGPNGLGLHVSHRGKSEIFVSVMALEQGFRCVVETLVHELDHALYGYKDMSREFRDVADKRICDLLLKVGYDVDIVLEEDAVKIPISYAASLGSVKYEITSTGNGAIIHIGNTKLFIDQDLNNMHGVMSPSDDGENFIIGIDGLKPNSVVSRL